MTDDLLLLAGGNIRINDKITLRHPTLREIVEMGEEKYYSIVSTLCATPSDYKSILLDNFGLDYEEVSEFGFFMSLWASLTDDDLSIILPGIKPSNFKPAFDNKENKPILLDSSNNICITEDDYLRLVDYIRKFHGFEKRVDKAGNAATKDYFIRKARKELKRKPKDRKSVLAPLVSAMVNCEQFKYNHKTVWEMNIYQFMDSVKRIQKIKSAENILQGIYSGSVDSKKISKESYNWLGAL